MMVQLTKAIGSAHPRAIPDVVRISVTPKIQCQSRFGHQRHLLAGH